MGSEYQHAGPFSCHLSFQKVALAPTQDLYVFSPDGHLDPAEQQRALKPSQRMAIPLSHFLPLGSLSTSSCEPSSRLGDHTECCACPAVDDRSGLGVSLLDELFRDCRSGKHHHNEFYGDTWRFKQECPLGSSTFFGTAFTQAFRKVGQ